MTDNTISPPIREHGEGERESIARIIDSDAWHNLLPVDGCGQHWHGRRKKALVKADAILAALSAQPVKDAVRREALDVATQLDALSSSHRPLLNAASRVLRALSSAPADVRKLVIAARIFWDERNDDTPESRDLDQALEAFSGRVPYADEPGALSPKSPASVGLDPETIERCAKVAERFEIDREDSSLDDRDIGFLNEGERLACEGITAAIRALTPEDRP